MANRPFCATWPPQQPHPPPHHRPQGQNAAAEFHPGMPYPQHLTRPNTPSFYQYPPRGPGASPGLPGPPGHGFGAYGNVDPVVGRSPGFNNYFPGWSPYPRGYSGTVPSPRTTSPSTIHSQSQNLVPEPGYCGQGNIVPVVPPSHDQEQGYGQQTGQVHEGFYAPRRDYRSPSIVGHSGSAGMPWLNGVRPHSSVKPTFLDWIDEKVKEASSLKEPSHNSVLPKSSDLHRLVEKVEDVISKILALNGIEDLTTETEWGVCPSDPHHVVPLGALHRHTLQCPSHLIGKPEASSLLDCLQYPRSLDLGSAEPLVHDEGNTENLLKISPVNAKVRRSNQSEKSERGSLTLSTTKQEFDPKGSLFLYRDAPGVVLTSVAHHSSSGSYDVLSTMPYSLRKELEKCGYTTSKGMNNEETNLRSAGTSPKAIDNAGVDNCHADGESYLSCVKLLPSMLWKLEMELGLWTDMPSQCSRTVLSAAIGLEWVTKASIVEWLLLHSPGFGVVLDVPMAAHISCLVQIYLRALKTQSLSVFDETFVKCLRKGDAFTLSDTKVVDCAMFSEASTWLASWLSHLYGHTSSRAMVVAILKQCLKLSVRFLSIVPLDFHLQHNGFKSRRENVNAVARCDEESEAFTKCSKISLKRNENSHVYTSNLVAFEDKLDVKLVGAAMDAIYERANFDRYIKSWLSFNNVPKPQWIANYEVTVMSANNERAKRSDYHPVCEHDGLTWQRSHQEEKRNKTKAELLAEERDYKRRRMSYRGKKLKRTPLQVLHDIIENHMTEITEAGGIGCSLKQPLLTPVESQQQEQGSISSMSHYKHQSGNAQHSRIADTEAAGAVVRFDDDNNDTSSVVRNESRSRNYDRHFDGRHQHVRR